MVRVIWIFSFIFNGKYVLKRKIRLPPKYTNIKVINFLQCKGLQHVWNENQTCTYISKQHFMISR